MCSVRLYRQRRKVIIIDEKCFYWILENDCYNIDECFDKVCVMCFMEKAERYNNCNNEISLTVILCAKKPITNVSLLIIFFCVQTCTF